MFIAVNYTAYQVSNPNKTVAGLISDKVKVFLAPNAGITLKNKIDGIEFYRCTACDPIYKLAFNHFADIGKMVDMKNGIIPFQDISFLINIPDHHLR